MRFGDPGSVGGRYLRVTAVAFACVLAAACGSDSRPPTTPPVVEPPPNPNPNPNPQPPPPPPTLTVSKILAFGDSMTEGVVSPPTALMAADWTLPLNAGRSESYPFKLKALIDARYTAQTIGVYNGGFAGKQAREDRGRFSQALSEGKPEVVLLLEGVNDLNQPFTSTEGQNSRIRSTVDALEDMVREAQFRNITVFIGTLPPQRPGAPKAYSVDLVDDFNAAVRVMAGKKGANVVEISQLPLSLIGQDGLHPTESGYQRMAEIWLDALKTKYEKPAATAVR